MAPVGLLRSFRRFVTDISVCVSCHVAVYVVYFIGSCALSLHEMSTVLDAADGFSLHPSPLHKAPKSYKLPTDRVLYRGPLGRKPNEPCCHMSVSIVTQE